MSHAGVGGAGDCLFLFVYVCAYVYVLLSLLLFLKMVIVCYALVQVKLLNLKYQTLPRTKTG